MKKPVLDYNNEFIVRQWKTLNLIVAVVMFIIAILIIANWTFDSFASSAIMLLIVIPGFGIPALIYRRQALNNSPIIRINTTGIYHYERLITGWSNFHNAYVTNKMALGGYRDNFQLVIEFYKQDDLYEKKIPLTNTQNKSEEEVYEAVIYYSTLSSNSVKKVAALSESTSE
jgi:hypothetical protein